MHEFVSTDHRWKLVAMLGLIAITVLFTAQPAFCQSSKVVIIGGTTLDTGSNSDANLMNATYGGKLPVSVTADTRLGAFTFTPMPIASISAANLAGYDTAVLNLATYEFGCDSGKLTAQMKADIIAFVAGGKKLLIYDSECYVPGGVNYSWLPFPFTTANPGAMGAPGTLTIVENNTLSSNVQADAYYVNAAHLGTNTDAVGDMNVMTTNHPAWCVDMSGTNYLKVTGPVHTYAKYPSGTDQGLILYNGLDMDYMYVPDQELLKIWIFELQQKFNPSNLPCGFTVVGITLTPATATNIVGSTHTVTAKLTDLLGSPKPSVQVTFTILSGPNAGKTGSCDTGATCLTAANGEVKFTYTGGNTAGKDVIEASFLNQGVVVKSQQVEKIWVPPPTIDVAVDIKPGSCPNPFNVGSKGVIPVAIVGMSTFDVRKVDPATVRLEGVAPLRWALEDAATPYLPLIGKPGAYACVQLTGDGLLDLVFHFDSVAVQAALTKPIVDREVRALKLTGYLKPEFGGTKVVGEDVVVLLNK